MNDTAYAELLPAVTDANRPYWDGCAAGELRLQACQDCGWIRFPEAPLCPRCLSEAARWQPMSGHGIVWSWIRIHQQYFPAFADETPYVVIFARLDEGPMIVSGFAAGRDPVVDEPVQVVFTARAGRVLPLFAPANGPA